jgi:hypothetical protein
MELPRDKIDTTLYPSSFHSEDVSKLYLFSSNKPSSIALISVKRECHVISTCRSIVDKKKEAHAEQGASSGIGTWQGSLRLVEYRFLTFVPKNGRTYHAPKMRESYVTHGSLHLALGV